MLIFDLSFMKFSPLFQTATLLTRYKRFLADIRLPDGSVTTIHCPNTGSMKNCIVVNSPCWYSVSNNPKRKYPFTWEIATTPGGYLAGVNTGRANNLVREGIEIGVIEELAGYREIQAEVKYGDENSRIDFLLCDKRLSDSLLDGANEKQVDCYVEVKSVTLGMGGGLGLFPDSVSARGAKHLRELMLMVKQGHRAVLVFCVQHTGIEQVSPADDIDPVYGQLLREAISKGVEVLVYGTAISAEEIVLTRRLSLLL
jgi:sugar fermentation stimulation protein A